MDAKNSYVAIEKAMKLAFCLPLVKQNGRQEMSTAQRWWCGAGGAHSQFTRSVHSLPSIDFFSGDFETFLTLIIRL